MKRLALACALVLAISASAEASWTVARSSGQVWIGGNGAQKVSLLPRADLPSGATITTGASGRVMLTRNQEVMTIGPNAVVTIPADNMLGFTTILQTAGQIEFDVEKKNVRHFAVDTPFLAAVVKGTHFVVQVNRSRAKVSVSRGRVGVSDNATGQRSDITPGQSAEVSIGGMVLSGKGVVQPAAAFGVANLFGGKKPKADAGDGDVGKGKEKDKGKEDQAPKDDKGDKGKDSGKSGKGSSAGSSNSESGGSDNGNSGHGGGNSGSNGHGHGHDD